MIGSDGKALIVQSDGTLLIDVHSADFDGARNDISPFSELEKSPEHIHTYRMTPLSLWNAASAGLMETEITDALRNHARYPVPENILYFIGDTISRFGKIRLLGTDTAERLFLEVMEEEVYAELSSHKRLAKLLMPVENGFIIQLYDRGTVKQELIRVGYPVRDEAPLAEGEFLDFGLRNTSTDGRLFAPRDYQQEAAKAFLGNGRPGTGFGTIVLPCGAGKTVVGMAVMDMLKTSTLILTTNVAAVHQWIDELLDKSGLSEDMIGEYTGDRKVIKPVTVGTYQILVWRPDKESEFPHFKIFVNESGVS